MNIDPAKHSRVIIKLLVVRIRAEWPEVRIIVRGDSGLCRWKLMRWCENHSVDDVFGIGRHKVPDGRIAPLMDEAEAAFNETGLKQRLFGETAYAAGTWDRSRRVIMKAERLLEGPNRRFVVTSLDAPPQSVYDDEGYTPRGDMRTASRNNNGCSSPTAPAVTSFWRIRFDCGSVRPRTSCCIICEASTSPTPTWPPLRPIACD